MGVDAAGRTLAWEWLESSEEDGDGWVVSVTLRPQGVGTREAGLHCPVSTFDSLYSGHTTATGTTSHHLVATACADGTVGIWDLVQGLKLGVMRLTHQSGMLATPLPTQPVHSPKPRRRKHRRGRSNAHHATHTSSSGTGSPRGASLGVVGVAWGPKGRRLVVLATDGQLSVWDTSSFHYNVREMCAQRRHLARLQSRNKGAAVGEQSSGANAAHNPSAATDHGAGLSLPSMRHRPRGGATPLIYADAGDAHVCRTPPRMPHLAASARGKPLPSPTTRTTVDLHRSGPAYDSASPVSLPHQVGYQASLHVSCAHGSAASCWAVDTHAGLAATAGEDGMLRLWDLESGAALASACVVGSGLLVAWVWRHMCAVRFVQTRGQPRDTRCHATVRAQRVLRARQTRVGGGCFVGRRGCILPTDTHHRQCWSWAQGNPASIGPVQGHTWQRASAWSRYVAACRTAQLVATQAPCSALCLVRGAQAELRNPCFR